MVRALNVAIVTALVMTACSTTSKNSGPLDPLMPDSIEAPLLSDSGLLSAVKRRFEDVPLPVGAKEEPEQTYVYQTDSVQVGRMVYRSKASVNELAQFFIKECPTTGWTLETVLQADGTELIFKRPGSRLRVSIRELGLVRRGTRLILYLTPDE